MTAYQNPFPVGYNPYQYNAYQAAMQQYQQQTAPQQMGGSFQNGNNQFMQQQPQAMTYPTIHADIVQTDDDGVIERWGVTQDRPQMFITSSEDKITIKSIGGNGVILDVYKKQPPAPADPPFNPAEYVRRDELPDLIAAAVAAQAAPKLTRKKEPEPEA